MVERRGFRNVSSLLTHLRRATQDNIIDTRRIKTRALLQGLIKST